MISILSVGFGNRYNRSAVNITPAIVESVRKAVNRSRLIETAVQLISAPSWTGQAEKACDGLVQILSRDGFEVDRPAAGHPQAPAVVTWLKSSRPGKTLQFNGHLDTVHLPFVAPQVDGDLITGSGAADMKGGIAAAVEALRVIRETSILPAGLVFLTAHDLHEAPWGFGQQLDQLIGDRCFGDGILLPEPLHDRLPVVGRGGATWKVTIRRSGAPVHEVMRPMDQPSVIAAGSDLVTRLSRLGEALAKKTDPLAGPETVFIGQIHSGEIYNQFPQECWLEGTRRWLPGTSRAQVESEFRSLLADVERDTKTTIQTDFQFIRDGFHLDQSDPLVDAFQQAFEAVVGARLPFGPKPFMDDGNSFWGLAQKPAITHGPRAGGQHTVNEWVSIEDLVRLAQVYALTAVAYCA
jgi:acetylornithine deacetylase/succinyl-diaminopimelate desuccinylase-like protein